MLIETKEDMYINNVEVNNFALFLKQNVKYI